MKQNKSERINIRITKAVKKWMKKNKHSPAKIFNSAVKMLGFKEDE